VAPARAVVVGDSAHDREAARAAGALFVGLGTPGELEVDALAELLRWSQASS
jgi:phosphoglycolate phosphatase-like HAD superfamily hydrolase